MKMEIDNNIIDVIIVKKSIKNMYFRIDDNLNLLVTTNKWVSSNEIERVIKSKYDAIKKMYYFKLKEKDNDMFFTYLGDKYNVIYDDNIKECYLDNKNIYTKNDKMLDKFYINKCREIFQNKLEEKLILFPHVTNVKLKLRNMKTRWGVCNRYNHTVTLNTELLKKDISLLDYVIIHELCHFKHPNHGPSFWENVSKLYPYYKNARKMLKD